MTAASITPAEREVLDPAALERLEELLSFDHGPRWGRDHPPGFSVPIDGPLTVDEHLEGSP